MKRVAADENLHFLFYRDLVSAAIELDPSDMVAEIERVVLGSPCRARGYPTTGPTPRP